MSRLDEYEKIITSQSAVSNQDESQRNSVNILYDSQL